MDGSVLRLFRFRPRGPGSVLDATLRESVAPCLAGLEGLRRLHLGRRGPDESGERVVVSVWSSSAAMTGGLGIDSGSAGLDVDLAVSVDEPVVEVLPIRVEVPDGVPGTPGILRVFRGQTHPGLLDEYVEDVRRGTLADVEAGIGPLALYLGLAGPVDFVTVSVWAGWGDIEAATGGNVRRPVATRHAGRLAGGTASHYEALPEAATPAAGSGSAA